MTTTNDNTKTITADINMANVNNPSLTLSFANGEQLVINASDISVTIAQHAMMHGLKQKLVDAAAISRNSDTGRSATVTDKYNAVREVYDRLLAGQWNKGREAGSGSSGGLLYRALCLMYTAKSPDQIKAFLDSKSASEKAALRATPKIAAIIDTLRDTSEVDADAMLADLN